MTDLPVISFRPDWSDQVVETLDWMTAVYQSDTGVEQRQKLRLSPRRSFEYRVLVFNNERSYFDNFIRTYGSQQMWLPVWHVADALAVKATGGSSTLTMLQSVDPEFIAAGTVALIGASAFTYATATVETVSGNAITLSAPLAADWLAGTTVVPVKPAKLTDQPSYTRQADEAMYTTIRLQIDGANDHAGSFADMDMYDGLPVLTLAPDEREDLTYGVTRLTQQIDNQTGLVEVFDTAGIAFATQAYRWTKFDRATAEYLRTLMYALAGQLNVIWLPTFFSDLVLSQPVSAASNVIVVQACGYGLLGGPSSGRQDIMIELYNGSRIYRRITAVGDDDEDGEESLELNASVGLDISVAMVRRISFMTVARSSQDSFEIDHQTDADGAATCAISFKEIPDTRLLPQIAQLLVPSDGLGSPTTALVDWHRRLVYLLSATANTMRSYKLALITQNPILSAVLPFPALDFNGFAGAVLDPVTGVLFAPGQSFDDTQRVVSVDLSSMTASFTYGALSSPLHQLGYPTDLQSLRGLMCVGCGTQDTGGYSQVGYLFAIAFTAAGFAPLWSAFRTDSATGAGFSIAIEWTAFCRGESGPAGGSIFIADTSTSTALKLSTIKIAPGAETYDIASWPATPNPYITNAVICTIPMATIDANATAMACSNMGYDTAGKVVLLDITISIGLSSGKTYFVGVSPVDGSILWSTQLDVGGNTLGRSRVRQSTLLSLSSGISTTVDTLSGGLINSTLSGVAQTFLTSDDETALAVVGCAYTEEDGSPTPIDGTPSSFTGWGVVGLWGSSWT